MHANHVIAAADCIMYSLYNHDNIHTGYYLIKGLIEVILKILNSLERQMGNNKQALVLLADGGWSV